MSEEFLGYHTDSIPIKGEISGVFEDPYSF